MSTSFSLYPHQLEALNSAKTRNTIVNLPTGEGKTLIAAKLIEHHISNEPSKKVAFLVPTRALVKQQSSYCRRHCRLSNNPDSPAPVVVQQLVGQDQAEWTQADWDSCIRRSHILLGTAAIFQQAFVTDKYIDISMFSLIVFDECHNACGNSPMAAVMRDAVAPHQEKGFNGPRILGLTASFINGSMKNIEKKRREIETLLLSTIICPDVKNRIDDDRFKFISWSKARDAAVHKIAIENHVTRAVQHVEAIKEITKAVRNCTHVFEELGCDALVFYIDKVIVNQINVKARHLKEQVDAASVRLADRMLRGIPHLKLELKVLCQGLEADPVIQETDSMSMKVRCLIDLLIPLFRENGSGYRGIVFVERVALVSSMAKVLNDALTSFMIRCGAVAGTGSQNENERQSQLDMFRSGEIQILVSTAALEEGIDVSECAFVVRYTSITTTKAHIQGAGRARHPKALILYFENDPQLERRKEKALNVAAKDKSLSLTTQELQKAATSINIPFDERHPYPFQGRRVIDADDQGEVNVFNCKQIFNQYCSMSLGASIQPKKILFKYEWTAGGRKVLSMVRYPSPHGWVTLSYIDFKSFWGKTNFDPIFCEQRVKRKTTLEKEEMCFVYMVVVQLREDKFLNSHNKVNPTIGIHVRQNCPLDADWPRTIAINNRVFQSENML